MTNIAPHPAEIKEKRATAKLTQAAAAALIYTPRRTWQDWEKGIAPMHPGLWELWQLKAAALAHD